MTLVAPRRFCQENRSAGGVDGHHVMRFRTQAQYPLYRAPVYLDHHSFRIPDFSLTRPLLLAASLIRHVQAARATALAAKSYSAMEAARTCTVSVPSASAVCSARTRRLRTTSAAAIRVLSPLAKPSYACISARGGIVVSTCSSLV